MLIATDSKVYSLVDGAAGQEPALLYEGNQIARVAQGGRLAVIALKNGDLILKRDETSKTIETGIEDPVESLLIPGEEPLNLLIGTEGPHLYRFDGERAVHVESFDQLECRKNWYTPWGGPAALRSLAGTNDGWVYADIHVGSIMRSADMGASWEPVTRELHDDVHQVATSPQDSARVYANTADAVYISEDRGKSWSSRSQGFPFKYGRAIAVHPKDPECLLATVSKGPHGNSQGRLYRTDDAGGVWEHVTGGFPEAAPGNVDTYHLAFSTDGTAWAVVGATLYRSDDRGRYWSSVWESPKKIKMIA